MYLLLYSIDLTVQLERFAINDSDGDVVLVGQRLVERPGNAGRQVRRGLRQAQWCPDSRRQRVRDAAQGFVHRP